MRPQPAGPPCRVRKWGPTARTTKQPREAPERPWASGGALAAALFPAGAPALGHLPPPGVDAALGAAALAARLGAGRRAAGPGRRGGPDRPGGPRSLAGAWSGRTGTHTPA